MTREAESRVRDLLEAWRTEPIDAAQLGVQDQPQLQNVAKTLRGVALARKRKRSFRRVAAALALAAGVLGVALGGWVVGHEHADSGAPAVAAGAGVRLAEYAGDLQVLDAGGRPLARSAALDVGAQLETRQGVALLAFPSGAQARTAASTLLNVSAAGRLMTERGSGGLAESLLLQRGAVDVEVPKLSQPVEFSVQTPDARVVVHGTRFSVRVDPSAPAGARTHVAVTRGLVAVHAGGEPHWLRAGEEWPPPVATEASASDRGAEEGRVLARDPEPPVLDSAESRAHRLPPRSVPRSVQRSVPRSAARSARAEHNSLAAENRLFAIAMAKHKAGDHAGALYEIERLIEQYPSSILLQEARVERFRLLHRLGRVAEAARHARNYLGDYRDGYAREEARDIAMESP